MHADTRKQYDLLAVRQLVSTPEQLAERVAATTATWKSFIREFNISAE
mgnify:CR=1 FL=1